MTTKEIISALRRGLFSDILLRLAADTIEKLESENNRQKEEIERLTLEYAGFQAGVKRFIEDSKTAKSEYIVPARSGGKTRFVRMKIDTIKAEAYKEVFEKLRAEYSKRFLVSGDTVIEILNEAEKEMVGES